MSYYGNLKSSILNDLSANGSQSQNSLLSRSEELNHSNNKIEELHPNKLLEVKMHPPATWRKDGLNPIDEEVPDDLWNPYDSMTHDDTNVKFQSNLKSFRTLREAKGAGQSKDNKLIKTNFMGVDCWHVTGSDEIPAPLTKKYFTQGPVITYSENRIDPGSLKKKSVANPVEVDQVHGITAQAESPKPSVLSVQSDDFLSNFNQIQIKKNLGIAKNEEQPTKQPSNTNRVQQYDQIPPTTSDRFQRRKYYEKYNELSADQRPKFYELEPIRDGQLARKPVPVELLAYMDQNSRVTGVYQAGFQFDQNRQLLNHYQ